MQLVKNKRAKVYICLSKVTPATPLLVPKDVDSDIHECIMA